MSKDNTMIDKIGGKSRVKECLLFGAASVMQEDDEKVMDKQESLAIKLMSFMMLDKSFRSDDVGAVDILNSLLLAAAATVSSLNDAYDGWYDIRHHGFKKLIRKR